MFFYLNRYFDVALSISLYLYLYPTSFSSLGFILFLRMTISISHSISLRSSFCLSINQCSVFYTFYLFQLYLHSIFVYLHCASWPFFSCTIYLSLSLLFFLFPPTCSLVLAFILPCVASPIQCFPLFTFLLLSCTHTFIHVHKH